MMQRRVIHSADDFCLATAGGSGTRPWALKHHAAELRALTSTRGRDALAAAGIQPISFSELQR